MIINKSKLIDKINSRTPITKAAIAIVYEEMFDIIKEELAEGNSVKIPHLGQFELKHIKPKKYALSGQVRHRPESVAPSFRFFGFTGWFDKYSRENIDKLNK